MIEGMTKVCEWTYIVTFSQIQPDMPRLAHCILPLVKEIYKTKQYDFKQLQQ